ncbi:MAG: hypothetical protein COY40_06260 [Alphaproteobacteria bacterium CG_4_10_14_0_8_um_filter_53_9]|nr:MAG: hypothetical protein COY40_06260 [Alphaproteobacteria bacterium CG_4_10_14_0_8_um_filter_53_9]
MTKIVGSHSLRIVAIALYLALSCWGVNQIFRTAEVNTPSFWMGAFWVFTLALAGVWLTLTGLKLLEFARHGWKGTGPLIAAILVFLPVFVLFLAAAHPFVPHTMTPKELFSLLGGSLATWVMFAMMAGWRDNG